MSFLELKQLTKRFGNRTVVSAVDLTMDKGEILSLLGPSGCGKTTILRMIAGLITPDEGYIRVDERVYFDKGRQMPTEARQLGMVFQDLALWPHLTVAQNIAFGLRLRRHPAKFIAERVHELLTLVNLPDFGNRYPHQLSGGQQQRVAVARALATTPSIVLLDEPLSSLDTNLRAAMREELVQLFKRLNITAINVTHDQDEATMMSDRIMVLRDGHVQQLGIPTELYLEPKNPFVAAFIGEANFLRSQPLAKFPDDSHNAFEKVLVCGDEQNIPFSALISPEVRPQLDQGELVVMCRPDHVRVHAEQPDPHVPNVLKGTIRYTSFVGGRWRTLIQTPGQLETILAYPMFSPRIFQDVWIELPPNNCRLLPAPSAGERLTVAG
jgi:ABC-type Fe3+/spermidine/putrescine transport system ATPase subunit